MTSPMNITRRRLALPLPRSHGFRSRHSAWCKRDGRRSVHSPSARRVHARYLISVPLLILAGGFCVPWLWKIIEYSPRPA
jgi:hypothetical protein